MYTLVMNQDRTRLIQSEKMSAAGNLLAGIVHELNNPLTTILGFSELLLKEGAAADPSRLETIHSEAERSVRIIQNLLRLARADHGNPEAIDVNEAIRQTVELTRYQIRLNRIELDLKLSSKSPQALAHAGELTQVILNLVTNAVQAISAYRSSGIIEITSAVVRDRVLVSVMDDGPGISESHMRRIFDPFFTTKETGTGLGLSLSRNIIRDIGGDMWVTSKKGSGATFTLELPVVSRAIHTVAEPSPEDLLFTADRSVLIVDDESHITEFIESVLQECGYKTERLNDGAAAIELLKDREYDILICDLHMPGIGGRELIEWTRQNRHNTRVLLLSGDVARRETNDFAKNYGVQFLSKPFSVSELTKAVQRLAS